MEADSMNNADWAAISIAVPAVSAIILILKQLVKAYIHQMELQANQLKASDARQTQITGAFINHVEKQTLILSDVSGVLKEIVEKEDAQGALVEALTHELTKTLQQQIKSTLADHKKIWNTIANLCEELKCARLTRTEDAHTRTEEAKTRTQEAQTRADEAHHVVMEESTS
jgi:hypothetical protein